MAQSINYDDVVISEEVSPRDFEQYLVQLAWLNTAENRVLEAEKKIEELKYNQAKWDWVDDLSLNLNVNPSRETFVVNGNTYLQPGLTYGFSVNFGGLLTSGFERKLISEKVNIADHKINQQKLVIRAAVLKAYQKYKLTNEILKARLQAEEDATAAYNIISELFKKNRADVDEYTAASSTYFMALEQRQTAETEIELSILDLEELIGVTWESAERMEKLYKSKNK